jgi:hypothetical protein
VRACVRTLVFASEQHVGKEEGSNVEQHPTVVRSPSLERGFGAYLDPLLFNVVEQTFVDHVAVVETDEDERSALGRFEQHTRLACTTTTSMREDQHRGVSYYLEGDNR